MSVQEKVSGHQTTTSNGDNVTWSDKSNVTASDDNYASAYFLNANTISDNLILVLFEFDIPLNATIDGIEVSVEGHGSSVNYIIDNSVQLIVNGEFVGEDKAGHAWNGTDETVVYGSSTDTWGLSLTPSDINATDFGVKLSYEALVGGQLIYIDYVTIRVYYTEGGYITVHDTKVEVSGLDVVSTEYKFANTLTEADDGYVDWTNPQYARLDDSNFASVVLNDNGSEDLIYSNFGFNIPSDAVIKGIEIVLNQYATDSGGGYGWYVYNLGDINHYDSSDYKYDLATETETELIFGGEDDTWGHSFIPADINSPNFSFRVFSENQFPSNTTFYLDYAKIKIYYTSSSSGTPYVSIFDTKTGIITTIAVNQDTKSSVSSVYQLLQDTKTIAKKTVENTFDTLSKIINQYQTIHDTKSTISKSIQQLHDTNLELSTLLNQIHDTSISISSLISNSFDTKSSISNQISQIEDTLSKISNSIETIADISTTIKTSIQNLFDTKVEVSSTTLYTSIFDTKIQISNQIENIHDTLSKISNIISQLQDTLSKISNSYNISFDAKSKISSLISQIHDLKSTIKISIETLHDTKNTIASKINILFDTFSSVSNSIVSYFDTKVNIFKKLQSNLYKFIGICKSQFQAKSEIILSTKSNSKISNEIKVKSSIQKDVKYIDRNNWST